MSKALKETYPMIQRVAKIGDCIKNKATITELR
jgi:hypothetical protein